MKMIMMPGYRSLFGEPSKSYEEILKNVPSEIVIMVLMSLSTELNTSESHINKQKRLWERVSYRFTKEQYNNLETAFSNYNILVNGFDGTLFDRSCLLAMILKELERNNVCATDINAPIHEYNIFIAYLVFVDDVRKVDSSLLENAKKYKLEIMPTLPLLWAGGIRQYEFNHRVNMVYELFKLLCFLKYAYDKYNPFLKELVNKYSFQNLGQFMGSFNQVLNITTIDNPSEPLRKLVSIKPNQDMDISHLKALSSNHLFSKSKLGISDLRKYPLFETSIRGFMIIDEDMFRKKVYKGPLFEMFYETGLRKKIEKELKDPNQAFPNYKTKISKDFFENLFFKSIMKLMFKSKYDFSHFDDNVLGKPDLYYRHNKSVLLLEFKDYLFPDKILAGKEFANFKKYIDERFIVSDKDNPKGIEQLVNNISSIYKLEYDFDIGLNKAIKRKQKVKIYPIICHTDFMFSMPGINEYLNIVFEKKIEEKMMKFDNIQNVTIVSLEVLFDYAMRGEDFNSLSKLIDRYWDIIKNRKEKNKKMGTVNNFLATNVSFDEIYETKFRQELIKTHHYGKEEKLTGLAKMAGLTQAQLSEEL